MQAERHNQVRSSEQAAARVGRIVKRDAERAAKIKAAGIDYEYEGLEANRPKKAKRTEFADDA